MIAAVSMLAAESYAADQDVCRALAMSGGANNGAWEIGVLWGFINYGNAADFDYDVYTGVSVGALNASLLALFDYGDGQEMIQTISDIWRGLVNSDVWVNWPLSPVAGLFRQQGLLDNRPLLNFMNDTMSAYDQFYKRVTVSAMNIETGKVMMFNNDNTPVEDFYQAAFSATCIPGLFPSYQWENFQGSGETKLFNDNFMIGNVNVESAINE